MIQAFSLSPKQSLSFETLLSRLQTPLYPFSFSLPFAERPHLEVWIYPFIGNFFPFTSLFESQTPNYLAFHGLTPCEVPPFFISVKVIWSRGQTLPQVLATPAPYLVIYVTKDNPTAVPPPILSHGKFPADRFLFPPWIDVVHSVFPPLKFVVKLSYLIFLFLPPFDSTFFLFSVTLMPCEQWISLLVF